MKILIVDDQENNRYLLESLLAGNRHAVDAAANGMEAWDRLKTDEFDLIISDILMPVMDGFELCRKVKSDETLRHIPFIIYTATYTGPRDEEFALKIGANRFIVKPCEPDVFMKAVYEVTSADRQGHDDLPPPAREEEVLKLYNERLVRKLEQKMLQLENEVQTRREAEETLRESQEKYKSILNNIEDGYYEVDLAGNLKFFNPSMCRMLGYSATELRGLNNQAFMDKENARKVFETFNHVFATGEPRRALDWELIRKDGARCNVDTSISLIRDGDGNVIGFRGVARDITERKKAEKDKERLSAQLQQAQKLESIGRLAGGVAHDFNNLLLIILGYTELVLSSLDKAHPHHEPLEQVYQAGLRARDLTRQLLAFSRHQVLEIKAVDVNQILTGFEKLLRRLIGEDVELALLKDDNPLTVKADIAQLEQVLMNLAVNARDAMPNGGTLNIETAIVELDEAAIENKSGLLPGTYAMIGVSDTGFGMDRETRDRIFEPFFTTKEKDKGTGLGLATSYGIIRQHGGDIWVYSEPGGGTIFKIYLPLCANTPVDSPVIPKNPRPVAGSATVFIVEDDPMVRRLAAQILSGHGYTVIETDDAVDAVSRAASHKEPIHLVLSDLIMPKMKGPEVFEKIRESHPEALVLYMSGYTDNMLSYQNLVKEGGNYIQKPFTVTGLLEKCHKVLLGE
jgi:two-component system, cell cycle sensor histidine kinase and response regulator CckA